VLLLQIVVLMQHFRAREALIRLENHRSRDAGKVLDGLDGHVHGRGGNGQVLGRCHCFWRTNHLGLVSSAVVSC